MSVWHRLQSPNYLETPQKDGFRHQQTGWRSLEAQSLPILPVLLTQASRPTKMVAIPLSWHLRGQPSPPRTIEYRIGLSSAPPHWMLTGGSNC